MTISSPHHILCLCLEVWIWCLGVWELRKRKVPWWYRDRAFQWLPEICSKWQKDQRKIGPGTNEINKLKHWQVSYRVISLTVSPSPFPTDVLMELVLELDEAVVSFFRKSDPPERCTNNVRTDLLRRWMHDHLLRRGGRQPRVGGYWQFVLNVKVAGMKTNWELKWEARMKGGDK